MRFRRPLSLVVLVLLLVGCEPLPERPERSEPAAETYTPLDSLPAEYGQLVAVTPHVGLAGPSDWYELWFSEPTTGRITLVPVWRPGLSYPESEVRVIERVPPAAAPTTQPAQ